MTHDDVTASIADAIRTLGYRATVEDGQVLTSVSGMKTVVSWSEPGTLQFAVGIRGTPDTFGLEEVNAFNREFRFTSVYRNPDGSLVLQADFFHNAGADPSELEKMLVLFEAGVGEFRQALFRSAVNEEDARLAD